MSKAWMPLYIGDFLADTMHLNCQETGAYIRLIMHAWEHGGFVPNDDAQLARIAHCHPPHWPRLRKVLEPFLDLTKTPGLGYIKRVGLELIKASEITNKRKAAAQQMHQKRRGFAYGEHRQSQSQSPSKVTVTASKPGPARSGSNGQRAAPGNAEIGERMGKYVWDGTHWAEADHWTPRQPHAFGDPR
jgi:uncharacterized protein YdaU (DUF1376 family)